MGKRELLLVIAFAIVGVVVYQITAPPPPPGSQGFSFSRIVQNLRRGIQGNRAVAEIDRSRVEPIDSGIQELRFRLAGTDLTVIGEDRTDADFQMHVTSRAFDDAEAKRAAEASQLVVTRAGSSLIVNISFPREGRQRAKLTVKLPKRLRMRLDPMGGGKFDISGVTALEVMGVSGDTSVKQIAGPVTMNHRGGELTIDGAGSLKLNTRGGDVKVRRIAGALWVQTFGGDLVLQDITGPAEVEARNTDVRLENIKALKPPLRIDATNGSVKIDGLRTDARMDGRDTAFDVAFDAAAPVTIYTTSEDITITPPPGGYALDAVATDGHISIGDGSLKPNGTEMEQRVQGAIRGGGPPLTLRATRADINVRTRAK